MLAELLPVERLTVSEAILAQVRADAEARAELAARYGLLSAGEVAVAAGSSPRNAAAMASWWCKEGQIFAVEVEGVTRYPGYQFDSAGRPLPAVAAVLAAFGDRLGSWEIALWFVAANGWLGGLEPVEVLETEPEALAEAAGRLADGLLV